MKIAILTANLGNFDKPVDPVKQDLPKGIEYRFHRFTDEDFPSIAGLTPRMQYRIPKLFGWQMFPNYDYYLWLDGTFSLLNEGSLNYFLHKVLGHDIALFKHPNRDTIQQEVEHIEDHLRRGKPYIVSRYKNGLHRLQLDEIQRDSNYRDTVLYTSTAFMYHNNKKVREMLMMWWYFQSRYFTCDQVVLPYLVYKNSLDVNMMLENQYKTPYLSMVSEHK